MLRLIFALILLPLPALADPLRILAFGDSLTEGYGLPADQGLVSQLQTWLDQRGHDVIVLNGGLTGDTTAGGRVRIAYSIARHKPDAVMVELGGNDLLLGFSPQMVERNLDSILAQIGTRPTLLVGIASRDADEAWLNIWPRLARRHGALLHSNLYGVLLALPDDQAPVTMQRDGVHASAKGIALVVESLGPQVESLISRTR